MSALFHIVFIVTVMKSLIEQTLLHRYAFKWGLIEQMMYMTCFNITGSYIVLW